ncbi:MULTISPECIES: GNAT family N-acetyltransferase [Actinokineospora]|uniref:N-acetyltransferase n=1 Tax=Actinokineospora fastidiosa TaxID=1816 RepID=A0A918L6K0_9PSEU|nr:MULTISPECIES: GNAT family protein [Actinokineospora]UVS77028.1 Spermidine N(1)-acetyltransferase [Actinokineospora sp. UTMC 2448]GGS13976.1 N-acetyltransferase [Actinokineospora fastidiosa]
MSLTGRLVRLRAMEPEDADTVWRWHNDPEVVTWLTGIYPEPLAAIRKRWADRPANSFERTVFGIETIAEGRLIGVIVLRDATPETARAELDVYIGEKDCWDGGYGTEALRLMCRFGFEFMRLHAIELSVVDENERARHVYRKIGFVEEGKLREAFRRNGKWHDVYVMSMLEGELIE